jgi:uncharacterized protein
MPSYHILSIIDHRTVAVLAILFLATVIRSAFGFGEALVSVPLLAFWIPISVAVPLAVLVSITIAGVVVVQDWRQIQFRSTAWLVGATLPGIAIGVAGLTRLPPSGVKITLGIVILAFSGYLLLVKRAPELRSDNPRWLLATGFIAGILGGAYGMNGPPLVLYGAMRRWSAQEFRATLQGYFLPASIVGMLGYAASGLWTTSVTRYFAVSLPVVLPAILLGRMVNRRIQGDLFLRLVYAGLMATGLLLVLQSIP